VRNRGYSTARGCRIYQDAQAQTVTNAAVPSAAPAGGLSIAGGPQGGERLIGALDELRVWTVARTAQDIADSYTVSLSGLEPGLAAYYRLDEGRGSLARDALGGQSIVLVNAPLWITSGAPLATADR